MQNLSGKVAIITGGCSGIGLATVERFIAEGALVAVADLDTTRGEALERQNPGKLKFLTCDVTQENEIKRLVEGAVERFDRLDIMFNNAGGAVSVLTAETMVVEEWDRALSLNLRAAMLGIKHAAPIMTARGGGSIISTSSIAGITSGWGTYAYAVAKAGLIHMTTMAAAEFAHKKVRINAICPGVICTPALGDFLGFPFKNGEMDPRLVAMASKIQPFPRPALPRDIADVAVFLASDSSEFITGQNLVVDGGLTLGPRHAWDPSAPSPFAVSI